MQFRFVLFLLFIMVMQTDASSTTLRNIWIKKIESGLGEGKHLASIFKQEKPFAIYHQIHRLSNFLGTVDSFISFLQGYNYTTDHGTYVSLMKTFVSVNDDIEQVLNRRFGNRFREIYFELRNIQFSYMLLNRFLRKVVEISCPDTTDCKQKLKWTIEIFRKDFDIEDHYNHIIKATLNGTRMSSSSILDKLKETSDCNAATMLDFGRNLFIRLFKAEQIVLVYRKLSMLGNSIDEIIDWSNDMYIIRTKIFEILGRCSKGSSSCKLKCKLGKCVHFNGTGHDMCSCPNFKDGKRCGIPNNVNLVKDSMSVMVTLHNIDMMNELIDINQAQRFLMASLDCPSSAILNVEEKMESKVHAITFSQSETGSFYRMYLEMNLFIKNVRAVLKCGSEVRYDVLYRPLHRLKQMLYIMDRLYRPMKYSFFRQKSLLGSFIEHNKENACNSEYKKRIVTLWRQFHLQQAIGVITLMQLKLVKDQSTTISRTEYIDLIDKQMQFARKESCSLDIPNSKNVHCGMFQLLESTKIENICQKGYVRKGGKFTTCSQTTSSCIPCNCNAKGSTSSDCDQNTGQCICKGGFFGHKCEHERKQDCKWSPWTSWSACSRWCGYGGTQKRIRHHDIVRLGLGKACAGGYSETKKCLVKCCSGSFRCTNSKLCDTNVPCQSCSCPTGGKSKNASCSDQTGNCYCSNEYYGSKCSNRNCNWGAWNNHGSSICGFGESTQHRSIIWQGEGTGRKCGQNGDKNTRCVSRG